jgi:hypothetical protein
MGRRHVWFSTLCAGCLFLACASSRRSPSGVPLRGWTRDSDTVDVSARGGIGDLHRHIRYSRATGTLSVEDSDPFAGAAEQHPARVLRLSRNLGLADRERVEALLERVQPDGAARAQRCAPGGCLWVELEGGDRLEDDATVRPLLQELSRYFPELRAY